MAESGRKIEWLRIALVTGASRGIGASIARKLSTEGFGVVINYNKNSDDAFKLADELKKNNKFVMELQADVSLKADVERLFNRIDCWMLDLAMAASQITDGIQRRPVFCCLINNAGIVGSRCNLLKDIDVDEEVDRVFGVNVKGPMLCAQEALKRMSTQIDFCQSDQWQAVLSHGDVLGRDRIKVSNEIMRKRLYNRGGSIVNVSSGSAYIGNPMVYGMSKAALNTMQIAMVQQCAEGNIRINTVSPGMTRTDMVEEIFDGKPEEKFAITIPMRRLGEPEEIANCVSFLVSDSASYVHGANLRCSGGKQPGTVIG